MAYVSKRGSSWSVRYNVMEDDGTITYKRVSGFPTREAAWAAAADLERKSDIGIDVHGDTYGCGYIMERWYDEHCRLLAATTRAKQSAAIDRLQRTFVYTLPVKKCTPAALNRLISALSDGVGGSAPISMRTAVGLTEPLRLSLSWAVQMGVIPANPLHGARLPRQEKREQRILNPQDIDDLIAASEGKAFRIPILLALFGGLRREEAAALRWDYVDFSRRTITIVEAMVCTSKGRIVLKSTKNTASRRTITLPRFVMDELAALPKHSQYVCVTDDHRPYAPGSFPQAVRRLIQKINKSRLGTAQPPMPQATYHDLRHTHAAILIRMGMQPKVIQERLGHSSIKITMDTYGYLMAGMQESVAEALDAAYDGTLQI